MTGGTVRRAARLFVLTEAVRDDIAARYGVPQERFDLVQPPVPDAFRPIPDGDVLNTVRAKYKLPEKFVLYTGLIQPRKNLVRLARAFRRLVRAGCEHALVVAGPRAWLDSGVLRELDAAGLRDRLVRTGYVDQADLPALYNAADAFAYVSLYEGFGIPVLEALACGVPVLASTDPALAEVAGGAAVHVDPLDEDAIADGLTRVLTDADWRARAQSAGPARAAAFTPERMARAALAGYRAAADR
jgi:glycosyltransferase involved in cell wall biosynthesis